MTLSWKAGEMHLKRTAFAALGTSIAAALLLLAVVPAKADDSQEIGIVRSVDRAHKTFTCECADNTLADMSKAKRYMAKYVTNKETEFSYHKPFPQGEDSATFAKVQPGSTVILDYHLEAGARVTDDVTVQSDDCRPKFCGPF